MYSILSYCSSNKMNLKLLLSSIRIKSNFFYEMCVNSACITACYKKKLYQYSNVFTFHSFLNINNNTFYRNYILNKS